MICHKGVAFVNHLFIHCLLAKFIWDYLGMMNRVRGFLIVKAIVWNIWLTRNVCIFYNIVLSVLAIILKIDLMIPSWFSAVADEARAEFEESIFTVGRSLEFLGQRVEEFTMVTKAEEAHDQITG